MAWRSARTAAPSPRPARTARSSSGTPPPAGKCSPCAATRAWSSAWRSAPTAAASPPPASTTPQALGRRHGPGGPHPARAVEPPSTASRSPPTAAASPRPAMIAPSSSGTPPRAQELLTLRGHAGCLAAWRSARTAAPSPPPARTAPCRLWDATPLTPERASGPRGPARGRVPLRQDRLPAAEVLGPHPPRRHPQHRGAAPRPGAGRGVWARAWWPDEAERQVASPVSPSRCSGRRCWRACGPTPPSPSRCVEQALALAEVVPGTRAASRRRPVGRSFEPAGCRRPRRIAWPCRQAEAACRLIPRRRRVI